MSIESLRARITELGPWHHDVEIAPGLRTGDPELAPFHKADADSPYLVDTAEEMQQLFADLFPDGLAGRSLLDCACNAGGHVLAARDHGAGRAFGFDARAHWIKQAEFLAEQLPGGSIAFAEAKLADLPTLNLEPFDVTLFKGLFYHLPDPVAQLRIAADLTRELIVVNTAATVGPERALVLRHENAASPMSGIDGLNWLPTGPPVVRSILAWCGFPHSRVRFNMDIGPGRKRFEVVAARDSAALIHYDGRRASRSKPAKQPPASLKERISRKLRGFL